jgi:hypothetical protein
VLFVGHFANAGEVELGEIGRDCAVKIRFDSENAGKDFVELALIGVSLVDDVEQSPGRIRGQSRGGMPARSARVDDVKRVHLEAAGPKNAILQQKQA